MTLRIPFRVGIALASLALLASGVTAQEVDLPDEPLKTVGLPEKPPWPPPDDKPKSLEQTCLVVAGIYNPDQMCEGLVVEDGGIDFDIDTWCEVMADFPLESDDPFACELNEDLTKGTCDEKKDACMRELADDDLYDRVYEICKRYAKLLDLECNMSPGHYNWCWDRYRECRWENRPTCFGEGMHDSWRCPPDTRCGDTTNECLEPCNVTCTDDDPYSQESYNTWMCPRGTECGYETGKCWDGHRAFYPDCGDDES